MEAFRQYSPYDPSAEEHKAMVTMAFMDQAAKDIRRKQKNIEGLQDKSLRELVQAVKKVFHNRKTGKETRKKQRPGNYRKKSTRIENYKRS